MASNNLEAKVTVREYPTSWEIQGEFNFNHLNLAEICFYLPLNNPKEGSTSELLPHLRLMKSKFQEHDEVSGSLNVRSTDILKRLSREIVQITPENKASISLTFTASLAKKFSERADEFFLANYHPVLMTHCPNSQLKEVEPESQFLNIKATILGPQGWQVIAGKELSTQNIKEIQYQSDQIPFVLGKGFKSKSFSFDGLSKNSGKLNVYYRNDSFLTLVNSFNDSIAKLSAWYGRFPYDHLNVIEFRDYVASHAPGIVAVNLPSEDTLKTLQTEILNWSHWACLHLLARQWWGASIKPKSSRDQWMIDGTIDYVIDEVLKDQNIRYDLFNVYDHGVNALSLSYLDAQYLSAALLKRDLTNKNLIDNQGRSTHSRAQQHPLSYIRQSMALRNLANLVGTDRMQLLIRSLSRRYAYNQIEPNDFIQFATQNHAQIINISSEETAEVFRYWLSSSKWPDFALEDYKSESGPDGSTVVQIDIKVTDCVPMRIPVHMKGPGNELNIYSFPINCLQNNGHYTNKFIVPSEPLVIELDPDHEVYDANRFNNRSSVNSVKFFPGNARQISDDSYTLLWIPYVFKRPSESLGIGIQSVLFKYLDSSLSGKIEHLPKTGKTGYDLSLSLGDLFSIASLDIGASRNFDDYSALYLFFNRNIYSFGDYLLRGSLRLREKSSIDTANSHTTSAFYGNLAPNSTDSFQTILEGEYEEMLKDSKNNFNYTRRSGAVTIRQADVFSLFHYQLKYFRGILTGTDTLPVIAKFFPKSLEEAHMRNDQGGFAANDISAFNGDIYFPLKDWTKKLGFLLSNRAEFRLFFDAGKTGEPFHILKDAGCGVQIPLGGDFVGVGSVMMSKVSLLATLWSSVDDTVNRNPQILFSFMEDL